MLGPKHVPATPRRSGRGSMGRQVGEAAPDVKAAPAVSSSSKGYITWRRNPGALNNQMISVAAAFDTAKAMGRTVYIEADATAMLENDPNPAAWWGKVRFVYS